MQDTHSPVRLNSWKSIAAFLERDERTCQRWEKVRQLPVHRVPGQRGSVFAYSHELLAWLHKTQLEDGAAALEDQPLRPGDPATSPPANPGPGQSGSPEPAPAEAPGAASLPGPPALLGGLRLRRLRPLQWTAAGLCTLLLLAAALPFLRQHAAGRAAPQPASLAANVVPAAPAEDAAAAGSPSHELDLRGRFSLEKRSPESLHMALQAFQQAELQNPSDAQAYIGEAETYDLLPEFSPTPAADAFPRGLAAARTAVRLDPASADAHRVLAFGLFYWEWKTEAALAEFERSLQLNPADAQTHHWYANALLALRRLPQAQQEIRRARDLNPTSQSILADEALIEGVAGNTDAALAMLTDLQRVDPTFSSSAQYRSSLLEGTRRYPDWIAALKAQAASSRDPLSRELAQAAERGWRQGGEQAMLQQVRSVQEHALAQQKVSPILLVNTCIRLGDYASAVRYLQQAYAQNDFQVLVLLSDRSSAALDATPGFAAIKQAVQSRMKTVES